jgi:putative heme iron utilization protein
MGWIKGSSLSEDSTIEPKHTADSPLASQEASIIEHMNADHVHSLIAYCQHYQGVKASQVKILGIDVDGFDTRAVLNDGTTKILRFNFAQPIHDAQSARAALITMSKEAKI